jgi:hypothetical protein
LQRIAQPLQVAARDDLPLLSREAFGFHHSFGVLHVRAEQVGVLDQLDEK